MAEKRNAHVQQNHHAVEQQQRNRFDGYGLTKRNADYMFRFNRALQATELSAERKNEVVQQMIDELTSDQKSGKTARNLYGTVEQRVDAVVNPPKPKIKMTQNFGPNAVYNGLFFFVLFNILYGIVDMIQKTGTKQSVGIISLMLMSAAFGVCTPFLTCLLDSNVQHKYNGWMRGLFMLLSIVGWMLVFLIVLAIPQKGINMVVPSMVNFGLAAVAIVADIYVYRHYTITVNFFSPGYNARKRK